MERGIIVRLHKDFEQSVYKDEETGLEFWLARNLQNLLGYTKWENFAKVIEKAKTACKTAGFEAADHFLDIRKMVDLGSGSRRQIEFGKKITRRKLRMSNTAILKKNPPIKSGG